MTQNSSDSGIKSSLRDPACTNLFDKRYVASINKSGYRYAPGAPRTFVLSADIAF